MRSAPEGDGGAVPFSRLAAAVAAVLALGLPAGCSPPPDPRVLASWDGGAVTVERLDARVRELPAERRRPAAGESLADWVAARAADLAVGDILLARARAADLASSPPLALAARFAASQEIGRGRLFALCPDAPVPEAELAAAFERDYAGAPRPWILVRHIYKRALPEASAAERDAARAELAALARELDEGVSFLELARLHSDSETAADGGLIGRISRQAPIEPRVRDAAWALADGERSGIVEVPNGFHLLLRESSGVEEPPAFEQVREEIARRAGLARREACGREVLAALGARTAVTVDREALLAAGDPARIALSIGDETFTAGELRGLSPEGQPLALRPNPGELLRKFSEAVLLVADARESDPGSAARYEDAYGRALERALVEAQWRGERRAAIAERPEAELRAHFEAHRDRFRTDLELDVGLILISAGGAAGARPALERAHALRSRIRAGEPFEELAAEASEHVSRERQGRLGALPVPRLRVVLGSRGIAAASELAVGEVSDPVRIHDPPAAAFGLVKLYARAEPRARSYAEARDDVIANLAGERVRQLDQEVRQRLLAASGFAVHSRAVEDYVAGLAG